MAAINCFSRTFPTMHSRSHTRISIKFLRILPFSEIKTKRGVRYCTGHECTGIWARQCSAQCVSFPHHLPTRHLTRLPQNSRTLSQIKHNTKSIVLRQLEHFGLLKMEVNNWSCTFTGFLYYSDTVLCSQGRPGTFFFRSLRSHSLIRKEQILFKRQRLALEELRNLIRVYGVPNVGD